MRLNKETGKYELPAGFTTDNETPGQGIPRIDPNAIPPHADDDVSPGEETSGKVDAPKRKRRSSKIDFSGVESLLVSIHMGLAHLLDFKDLELTTAEAKRLADATANVARHYDLPDLPQKTVDWVMLMIALAAIYGPRIKSYSAKHSRALPLAKKAPQPASSPKVAEPTPLDFGGPDRLVDPNGFPVSSVGSENFR